MMADELLTGPTMLKMLLLTSFLTGCTTSGNSVARLADLPSPRVFGTTSSLGIDYDTSVGCFTLAPEVTATIDGHPVAISGGGSTETNAFNGKDCIGIGGTFTNLFDTNESVTSIVLADGQSTWNLDVQGLAPGSWSIHTPATVTEGSDVTVGFEPALAGVGVEMIDISPDRDIPFSHAATGNTTHIAAGYWSAEQPGSQLQGAIDVELGPLPVQCSGPQSCSFTTLTPNPANRTTISIPD